MAIFHPMAQTVEVTMKAERAGQERANVIHFRYNLPRPTALELSSLAQEVELNIIDQYEDSVSTGTRWYEIVCRDMHDFLGLQIVRSINRLSTNGGSVAPANVAMCLTKRTNIAGDSYRGRFYHMDCSEDMFNGDDLNPFYIGAMTTLGVRLYAPRVSGKFVGAVGSRTTAGSTPITAITFDSVADSQRRRLKKRGR